MRFGNEEALWLLLLIPSLAILFSLFNSMSSRRLERFAEKSLLDGILAGVNPPARRRQFFIFLLALIMLILALSRPQAGVEPQEVKRVGVDILVALDTSLSMVAEDIAPSRLHKAKKEIERLADSLEGNRIGLLTFAGESAVECPLTLDVATFKLFLNSVTLNSASLGGTDISGAIAKGSEALKASQAKSKAMILITDGEDNEGNPVDAARTAADSGIRIYTVGIGSAKGVPIPIRKDDGTLAGYKKDKNGDMVLTRLNSAALNDIAAYTDAIFTSSDGATLDISPIMRSIENMKKSDISSTRFSSYIERFQFFLGAAIMLLFLGRRF